MLSAFEGKHVVLFSRSRGEVAGSGVADHPTFDHCVVSIAVLFGG